MSLLNKLTLIHSVLALFAIYHFSVGLPSVLSLRWLQKVGSVLYKLKISANPDPQFEYVLKPLGLYALFTSFTTAFVLIFGDSKMKESFLLICAFLLISRGLCRLYYSDLFLRAFGTTPTRNRGHAIFTFFAGGICILLSIL